ncbi:MAG: glycoside hydrolase family 38 C-terminal domain-containing protein [Candidatus Latescibacterota bacterium]
MHRVIIVPETHWDRAWYSPFQEFRIRLVKLVDHLLDLLDNQPEYRVFVFDGQTVVLEDYLQVRPENEERLRRYIKGGRIEVGPWYVLCDEFLVSGEALVRNLLIGKRIAEHFGGRMNVGYVPDAFGHIAQLPQILCKSGIDSALFWRGMGDEGEELGSEFLWRGMDGESSVLGVHLVQGYCNASRLGYVTIFGDDEKEEFRLEHAKHRAEASIKGLAQYATTSVLLFNNGCDHVEPDPKLPKTIQYLNEHIEGAEFVHGDYRQYIDEVKAVRSDFKETQGEKRSGRYGFVLPSVYSARMYLKQANERTQTLLERYSDPLATLAWIHGTRHPEGVLAEAWKLLIKNHPHDDICGCSVDATHRDMVHRFEQAQQIGRVTARNSLAALAHEVDTAGMGTCAIVVFNPLSWKRDGWCQATVEIPIREAHGQHLHLIAPDGREISYEVDSVRIGDEDSIRIAKDRVCRYELSFVATEVPALGFRTFGVQMTTDEPSFQPTVRADDTSLENEALRVTVNSNGSLNVLDKETGQRWDNQNVFEDAEDVGDEYNYSHAQEGLRLTTADAHAQSQRAELGVTGATLKITVPFRLPKRIASDRKKRLSDTLLHPITSFVTLRPGARRVDIRTEIDNKAQDHRFRALFPTSIATNESTSEGQFVVLTRSMDHPSAEGWEEPPLPQEPQQAYTDLTDGRRGLMVVNQGLPEYEPQKGDQVTGGPGSTIALTLLRCVGWLSRKDLLTRSANAGPTVATPEAQCQGPHTFHYALVPHRGTLWDAETYRLAYEHNVPVKATVASSHDGPLSTEQSFVEISDPGILLSALKQAEDRQGAVIRLWNTTPEDRKTTVRIGFPIQEAALVSLMEEDPKPLTVHNGMLELSLRHFEIVTVLLRGFNR